LYKPIYRHPPIHWLKPQSKAPSRVSNNSRKTLLSFCESAQGACLPKTWNCNRNCHKGYVRAIIVRITILSWLRNMDINANACAVFEIGFPMSKFAFHMIYIHCFLNQCTSNFPFLLPPIVPSE